MGFFEWASQIEATVLGAPLEATSWALHQVGLGDNPIVQGIDTATGGLHEATHWVATEVYEPYIRPAIVETAKVTTTWTTAPVLVPIEATSWALENIGLGDNPVVKAIDYVTGTGDPLNRFNTGPLTTNIRKMVDITLDDPIDMVPVFNSGIRATQSYLASNEHDRQRYASLAELDAGFSAIELVTFGLATPEALPAQLAARLAIEEAAEAALSEAAEAAVTRTIISDTAVDVVDDALVHGADRIVVEDGAHVTAGDAAAATDTAESVAATDLAEGASLEAEGASLEAEGASLEAEGAAVNKSAARLKTVAKGATFVAGAALSVDGFRRQLELARSGNPTSTPPSEPSTRPVTSTKDKRRPQITHGADVNTLKAVQYVQSQNQQKKLNRIIAPDYSWMIVPLVIVAGVLLVSET